MQVLTQDWLAQNQFRRYPLMDGATLVDSTGTFTLPMGLLVDARVFIPASSYALLTAGLPYVYSVSGRQSTVIITLAVGSSLLSATVSKGYSMATVPLLDSVGASAGHVTTGRSDTLDFYGTYTFSATSAPLLPTLAVPYAPGVTSIAVRAEDGTLSKPLRGDVIIAAGTNITASGLDGKIRLDSDIADTEAEPCECEESFVPGPPVLTINGVMPDALGNIDLTEGGCVKITPKTAEIEIEDTCSKPCISAKDMDAINALVAALSAQQVGLSAAAGELANRVNNLLLPLLSSGTTIPEA